jgi:tetratricopeptide (TPR) repeat protein/TolB-like protein
VLRRIVIYVALVAGATSVARADASTVLVFPFENLSNDRTIDWIGEGVSELISQGLQPEPGVYIFTREERIALYDRLGIPETASLSRATALKLAWDSGADNMITGTFSGTADQFHISARLVDMEAGAASEIQVDGRLEDIIPLTMTLSLKLLKKIVPGTASPESDYTARPPTPRSAFENYVRGILNQDLQKRIDLLQTAVSLYPQYSAALFQLGRAFHLQREFRMSNQWLQKLPENAPDRRQVLFIAGLNYFYLGDYSHAITTYQQLPATHDVLLNLGAAFSQKGDSGSAISTWRRAAALDPLDSAAFFDMGYAYFLKGDFEGAEKNVGDSLKLRGRDSEALFLLGRTYEKLGRIDESQKLITQATRLSQRVERWLTQPLPRLERFATTTTFRSHEDVWNDPRLARRARGLGMSAWLDVVQSDLDAHLFGDALRELHDVTRIYPDSVEARSLLEEVDRQRNLK